jgi:hypothetical protein
MHTIKFKFRGMTVTYDRATGHVTAGNCGGQLEGFCTALQVAIARQLAA